MAADRKKNYEWMAKVGLASTVGWILVVAPVIGFLFGSWLDTKLHSSPWFLIIFTLIGVAAGFYEVIRIVIRLSK